MIEDFTVEPALTEHVADADQAKAAAWLSLRLAGCDCMLDVTAFDLTNFGDLSHHWHIEAAHEDGCTYMRRSAASTN